MRNLLSLSIGTLVVSVVLGVAGYYFLLPHHNDEQDGPLKNKASIRDVTSDIRTFTHPFSRMGMYVGVRCTVIKNEAGDLIAYNPVELSPEVRKSVAEFGTVKWIVAPSDVHHTFLDQWAEAYPAAKLVSPDGMADKHKKHRERFAVELKSHDDHPNLGSHVEIEFLKDYLQQEVLLFHKPSKTMLVADMTWNMPAIEAYSNVRITSAERGALAQRFADSLAPGSASHRALVTMAAGRSPSDPLRASMDKVFNKWAPKRIIVQHGEVIDQDATAKLKDTWSWSLKDAPTK